MRTIPIFGVVLVLLTAPGCKSLGLGDLPWPSQMGWLKNFFSDREEVTYFPTARENFKKAMDLYNREEWQDAAKYFDYVRTKFPHSRYAAIAELRLADSYFGREKWLDSIDAYRAFVRLHPTHDEVAYATFQVAKAYNRQIPEDWFFLPSASERDQSAAMDAVRAFDDFLIRFPDHERALEARTLRKAARSRLADNEWYVAQYYEGKHPMGAAFRYERIADLYPDVDFAPVGLMRAANIWQQDKDLKRAKLDFERVARDYPHFSQAKAAAKMANKLEETLRAVETAKEKAAATPAPPSPAAAGDAGVDANPEARDDEDGDEGDDPAQD